MYRYKSAKNIDKIKTIVHTEDMNTFKDLFEKYGLTPRQVVAHGLSYDTAVKLCRGERRIGANLAILYEEKLGIPRHELRPDLWPQPVTVKQPQPTEA